MCYHKQENHEGQVTTGKKKLSQRTGPLRSLDPTMQPLRGVTLLRQDKTQPENRPTEVIRSYNAATQGSDSTQTGQDSAREQAH